DVNLLKKTFQELKEEQDEWMNKQEVTLTENEALSQQISRVSKKYHQKEANIQQLEEELERETNRRRHLEEVKEEAVIILRHILMCPEDLPEAQWKIWRIPNPSSVAEMRSRLVLSTRLTRLPCSLIHSKSIAP
ncbi:hypothetical protein ATANTOWER_025632, partial [Ataeniobius toweri]|nr:hypothetical protein [Ataeniobius toweri]